MIRGIASTPEYFTRSGGSNQAFLNQLMLDLAGRSPTASELNSGLSVVTKSGRGGAVDFYYGNLSARTKRITDLYRRFLKREPDSKDVSVALKIANEADFITKLLVSQEYKTLASSRDDI